jgi:hypothetical protein
MIGDRRVIVTCRGAVRFEGTGGLIPDALAGCGAESCGVAR